MRKAARQARRYPRTLELLVIETAALTCSIMVYGLITRFPGMLVGSVWWPVSTAVYKTLAKQGVKFVIDKTVTRVLCTATFVIFGPTVLIHLMICWFVLSFDRRLQFMVSTQSKIYQTIHITKCAMDACHSCTVINVIPRLRSASYWLNIGICFFPRHYRLLIRPTNAKLVYIKLFCRASVHCLALLTLYELCMNRWTRLLMITFLLDIVMCMDSKQLKAPAPAKVQGEPKTTAPNETAVFDSRGYLCGA